MTKLNNYRLNTDFPAFGNDSVHEVSLDVPKGTIFNVSRGSIVAQSPTVSIEPDACLHATWNVNGADEWLGTHFSGFVVNCTLIIDGVEWPGTITLCLILSRDGGSVSTSLVSTGSMDEDADFSIRIEEALHITCRLRTFIPPA